MPKLRIGVLLWYDFESISCGTSVVCFGLCSCSKCRREFYWISTVWKDRRLCSSIFVLLFSLLYGPPEFVSLWSWSWVVKKQTTVLLSKKRCTNEKPIKSESHVVWYKFFDFSHMPSLYYLETECLVL